MSYPTVANYPLRLGSPAHFEAVRMLLRSAGFEEMTLCRALKVATLSDLGKLQGAEIDLGPLVNPLPLLIRLLLLGEVVAVAEFQEQLDSRTQQAFMELDLVRRGEFEPARFYSPIFLYPMDDLLIASDRQGNPDGSAFTEPPDMVFAALFPGTRRFLQLLPTRPIGEALDLCSGTGIGALQLSKRARRVAATDVTERSAHFMRFNVALNGCANVEVAVGDLFDAVPGRKFDVVVAHPPYVPSVGDQVIYRDGGDTGETILRRIVEGLPGALAVGGTFYSMSVGLDTREERLEERARGWLGPAQAEFDIVFGAGDEKSPAQAVDDIAKRARSIKTLDTERLAEAYRKMGTTRLVYGGLVIHRRAENSSPAAGIEIAPWTVRLRLSLETKGEDFDAVLDWHRRRIQPGFLELLAEMRLVLSPHLRVQVTHCVREGALVPADFLLEARRPFVTATRLDGWVVPLMARLNGQKTTREVHAAARNDAQVPPAFELEDWLKLVALLLERGYLVVPTWPGG